MGSACFQTSCQNEQTVYINNDSSNSNLSTTTNIPTFEIYNDKHKVCKVGPIRKKMLQKKLINSRNKNIFYSPCKYSNVAL
jgi:hypothetical protein